MAQLIRLYEENPNPKQINQVVEVLKKGGIIIYPTDTVYGLGCDITNNAAMERVARLKNINLEKANLSFISYDLSNLSDYTRQIDTPTYKILKRAFQNINNNKLKLFILICMEITKLLLK